MSKEASNGGKQHHNRNGSARCPRTVYVPVLNHCMDPAARCTCTERRWLWCLAGSGPPRYGKEEIIAALSTTVDPPERSFQSHALRQRTSLSAVLSHPGKRAAAGDRVRHGERPLLSVRAPCGQDPNATRNRGKLHDHGTYSTPLSHVQVSSGALHASIRLGESSSARERDSGPSPWQEPHVFRAPELEESQQHRQHQRPGRAHNVQVPPIGSQFILRLKNLSSRPPVHFPVEHDVRVQHSRQDWDSRTESPPSQLGPPYRAWAFAGSDSYFFDASSATKGMKLSRS
jgi:hypothetical protein